MKDEQRALNYPVLPLSLNRLSYHDTSEVTWHAHTQWEFKEKSQ